ncbi:hypothetical protein Patl1_04550 [Pistacia atlantica]|uniref:Uncharacterized protein n=1 Tax=Pistacia atlantica TaxID=434234 RepID=A0ACC1BVB1_9ROSI|nr:hypothetical protein Patl1_04550 [Pistacia atlantica]
MGAAVAKILSVFTNNAAIEKLNQHLPDEVTTSKIAENLAKKSAAVAVQEGLKFVPGVKNKKSLNVEEELIWNMGTVCISGPIVYKIVNRSLGDDKKSKEHKKDVQELKDKELKDKVGRMEKELSDCRKSLEQTKILLEVQERFLRRAIKAQRGQDIYRLPREVEQWSSVPSLVPHCLPLSGVRFGCLSFYQCIYSRSKQRFTPAY